MRMVRGILPIHFDGGVGELVDEFGPYLRPFFFVLVRGRMGIIIVVLRSDDDDEDAGGDDDDDGDGDGRQVGEGGASFRATLDGHFSCRSRMQVQVGVMMCGGFWGQLIGQAVSQVPETCCGFGNMIFFMP